VDVLRAARNLYPGMLAAMALVASACASQSGGPQLTPSERTELLTLKAQLADPARTATTKREAAMLLLMRTYPEASAALRDFLADPANRPAQIAVAQAIASSGRAREEFVEPLWEMLTGPEASVRTPAADALAAYRDARVLERLVALAASAQTERQTRLAVIAAMQRVLDKKAIDALVKLLDDDEEPIRDAAADSLTKLTNIRAFGRDARRWKSWWARNKDKPRTDWVADLAESLARSNLELERENAELRRRLAEAMNETYAAAPPAGRDALLVKMLQDPLVEVRLMGVRLTRQRLTGAQAVAEPLRAQVRARLADAEPGVRRAAALLVAGLRDPQAVDLLSKQLKQEKTAEAREAIYQAFALLHDASVWDQLLAGIAESDQRIATAAASALAQVADKNGAQDDRRAAAVEALKERYASARQEESGLREALLGAMGAMKDKRLAGLMTAALKDPAATVRLSAVKGLQRLDLPEGAEALLPLADDPDRGVRLAAVAAIGKLGGARHLESILKRTDPRLEPQAAVREQAWAVVMDLLAKADTGKLAELADRLAEREDAGKYLTGVLKLWAEAIPPEDVQGWTAVRLRLGQTLLDQDRPAEAAGELEKVHAALVKAGDRRARQVRLKWIEALLAADRPSAAAQIAQCEDEKEFAVAMAALNARLASLKSEKKWDALVELASAAWEQLEKRLDESGREALAATYQDALDQRRQADRRRVAELVARMTGTDQSARSTAAAELAGMKDRALAPLVEELRKVISADSPDANAEKAILETLSALAPQLKGYDVSASPAHKVKVLNSWLEQLGS